MQIKQLKYMSIKGVSEKPRDRHACEQRCYAEVRVLQEEIGTLFEHA